MTENNQEKFSSKTNFFFGFFVGLAIFSLIGFVALSFMLKKGDKVASGDNKNQEVSQDDGTQQGDSGPKIVGQVGTFVEVDSAVCEEDGKPIIRLFSTSSCPHCVWIGETFDKVAKEYMDQGKIKAYHWELDKNDNLLTEEKETQAPDSEISVLTEFNPEGYVPAFVFGCKYIRIGTGYEKDNDLAKEEAEFREIIDKLLGL